MNNIADLKHNVDVINYKTLPSVFDALYQINLHIGEYKHSARSNDYNGWLKCDGRSLSRTDYAPLFDIIGTTFGANDSNSFNLPDLQGRVLGGVGQGSGLTNRVFGAMVGAETHTLTTNQIPSHSHTITDPGHSHTQTTINDDFNNSGNNPPGFTGDGGGSMTWSNINSATTGITVNSTGGGQAHNNMQPTAFAANIFIFAGYHPTYTQVA